MTSQASVDPHSRELRTLVLANIPPTWLTKGLSNLAFDVNTVCTVLGRLKDRACFLAREEMAVWLLFKALLCTVFTEELCTLLVTHKCQLFCQERDFDTWTITRFELVQLNRDSSESDKELTLCKWRPRQPLFLD
jgi:hypothetical protein